MGKNIKILILVVILTLLVASSYFIYSKLNPNINEMPYKIVTDKEQISDIVTDSFLDILIEIKNYNSSEINYEDMLKATMRISRELNLLQVMSTDNNFYEYVPQNTIHSMITELTDKKVSKPINIEDFYYLYNEENQYYYVVPVGTDWIHINEIKEVRNINNGEYFVITCSTCVSDDGISSYDSGDITATLKYCPKNKYIRYQLVNMKHSEGTLEQI